jgi:hypothetical protein
LKEKDETPAMESKSHSKSFLNKAAKLKGGKSKSVSKKMSK